MITPEQRAEWRDDAGQNVYKPTNNRILALLDEVERLTAWFESAYVESIRAENAEAEVDRLQAELDEHRAHYVDPREHQRLRAGLTSLANDWYPGTPGLWRKNSWAQLTKEQCARQLRALLAVDRSSDPLTDDQRNDRQEQS